MVQAVPVQKLRGPLHQGVDRPLPRLQAVPRLHQVRPVQAGDGLLQRPVGSPGHRVHGAVVEGVGLVVPAQGRAGQRHVVVEPAQKVRSRGGGGFVDPPRPLKQRHGPLILAEGVHHRGRVHIGGPGAEGAAEVQRVDQGKRPLRRGHGLLPLGGLSVVAHQFVAHHQKPPQVVPRPGLLLPVQQVALRPGVVPPGHVFVQLPDHPLLGDGTDQRFVHCLLLDTNEE